MRNGDRRPEPHGDPQIVERLVLCAGCLLGQRQVIARLGMRRPQLHGLLQRCASRSDLFRPPERGAEMILRVEERGLQRHSLLEFVQRLGRPPEEAKHESEAIVSLRDPGSERDSSTVFFGCPGQISIALEDGAVDQMSALGTGGRRFGPQ